MVTLNPHADAARESARRPDGRFGRQQHTDPGQLGLDAETGPHVVPVTEHRDPLLGDVEFGVGRGGEAYVTGGPAVPAGEVVPDGADPGEYLGTWGGLVMDRASDAYLGQPGGGRVMYRQPLGDDVADPDAIAMLHSNRELLRLERDLGGRHGTVSVFARNLREELPEADLPDVSTRPDVLEALGDGPDLTDGQRYMLNVLLDPRNDPHGRKDPAMTDSLDDFDEWSADGESVPDWRQVGWRLERHAWRRGVDGGMVFDIAYDDGGDVAGYTVAVEHAGAGALITSSGNAAHLVDNTGAGLRGAVEAAGLFDREWRQLRHRLDRTLPGWRGSADPAF